MLLRDKSYGGVSKMAASPLFARGHEQFGGI
jgi:hypothetical protein